MPGWTSRNFDEIQDTAPTDAPLAWRFARREVEAEELGVSRLTYEPGGRFWD